MINMIVAASTNNGIGIHNTLPWHISEDLQYFKKMTSSHAILMGRKTYDSIGRPLPNRTNIVLTKDLNFAPEGVTVIHTVEEALSLFPHYPEVFIIGGGQIYNLLLPFVDNLYITLVQTEIDADTFFPEYSHLFKQVDASPLHYNEESQLTYQFTTWQKK